MGLYQEKCGYGKRKKSVTEQKKLKRLAVKAAVKKLKAAGKPVDLQAINHQVLDQFRRKRMPQKPKHAV
ncbi:MAG: hypothetical protein L0213_11540 [Candidatus Dadabacteria bacterium]|nr:hypothetical protein [Candidatus Dadabacteria bacterium]